MNQGINSINYNRPLPTLKTKRGAGKANFSNKLAGGALDTISTVGSLLPGGSIVSAAAKGIKLLTGVGSGSAGGDQMDKMWEMQKENQSFNLEYFELQNELQSDNRRFTTLSNLMKARHDTAKSAINNMNV